VQPRGYKVPVIAGTLALLLSGCAIPVAVSISSYGFTGFSMATTGKGVGDMALSQATEKNCATWRILKGDDICRDYTPDERHEIRLAHAEWSNYASGPRNSNEPDYVAMVPLRPHAEVVAEVEREEASERAVASIVPTPKPERVAVVESAPQPEPVVAVSMAPLAPVTTRHAEAILPLPPAAKPLAPRAVAALPLPTPTPKPTAALLHPPVTREGRADHAYIVLGSYSSRAGAESGLAHYAAIKPLLSVAVVEGKEVYRVVSGPFEAQDLARVRTNLAKSYDLRDSWTLPSCETASSSGCAVAKPADPQLAALLKRS